MESKSIFEFTQALDSLSIKNYNDVLELFSKKLEELDENTINKIIEYLIVCSCSGKGRIMINLCTDLVNKLSKENSRNFKKLLSLQCKKEFDKKTSTILSISQFMSFGFNNSCINEAIIHHAMLQLISINHSLFNRVKKNQLLFFFLIYFTFFKLRLQHIFFLCVERNWTS